MKIVQDDNLIDMLINYLDIDAPICNLLEILLRDKACISVFTTQNSTSGKPSQLCFMRFMALLPPPPTPITLMRHNGLSSPSGNEELVKELGL